MAQRWAGEVATLRKGERASLQFFVYHELRTGERLRRRTNTRGRDGPHTSFVRRTLVAHLYSIDVSLYNLTRQRVRVSMRVRATAACERVRSCNAPGRGRT